MSLKSLSDEWLNAICSKVLFCLKFSYEYCVEFSLMFLKTAKGDYVIKIRELFSFLPLINNSVTIGLSFLLLSI